MDRPDAGADDAEASDETSWRQRVRRWTRPPRQLAFTTAGKFFFLLTLGVGFGAVNTGNNLLFLLLGMMLSLILASGVLSEAVIRELDARRILPPRIVANRPSPGTYIIENPRTWASLSIEVGDRTAEGLAGPRSGEVVGEPAIPWWKIWKRRPKESRVISSAYTLRVGGGEKASVEARFDFPQRGRYLLPEITLATRFPFALFEKMRDRDDAVEVVVFPEPVEARDWATSVHGRFGEVDANRRGRGEEFFGLREYRPGEDRRKIHWKVSARRGDLVVREQEERVQRAVEIVLCDFTGRDDVPDEETLRAFEWTIRKTSGLVDELASRGYRIGLRTSDSLIAPGLGGRHVDRINHVLATVSLTRGVGNLPTEDVGQVGRLAIGEDAAVATAPFPLDLHLSLETPDEVET